MTTTRLHISGLTPSISQNDLKQRFSTFGEVKAVDGVGKLDGLGQPRKFAYVTLESTQAKLARCMNLLSGSTWKGAKLRIGEAKPDYKARHQLEINPPPRAPRPKLDSTALRRARLKRRLRARRLMRGVQGPEPKDMSLVTLENVDTRKVDKQGWRRTPLNHLIRPLRMRPLHPIPLPPKRHPLKLKLKNKNKIEPGSKKRVFKLTRARCTVIDPARYGAVHVSAGKGGLGDELLFGGVDVQDLVGLEGKKDGEGEGEGEVDMVDEVSSTISSGQDSEVERNLSATVAPVSTTVPSIPDPRDPTPPPSAPPSLNFPTLSLAKEKADTLALLGGLFSGDDWGGRESVSGDEGEVRDGEGGGEHVEYEVAPREDGEDEMRPDDEGDEPEDGPDGEGENMEGDEVEDEDGEDMDEQEDEASEEEEQDQSKNQQPAPEIRHNELKDMFKPQEEGAGFSFGLDIELDPDAESFLPASIQPQPQPEPQPPSAPITTHQTHTIQYTPDPSALMFFPTFGGKRDIFSVIEEKGWKWEHPGTSEEIRAKWEQNKAELTREYTKRHREAVKRRRRGGVVRGEDI
ncbi:hypothetical protein FRC12_005791 [Ceratobasidium sp. 428]|nr:hypothetical protein FRC12_005791 [Ceratobasidium sp. 428]